MMAILLEISIKHFFSSFVYTYGGKCFIQVDGGPIGARLTMCVARLVLQDWYEDFNKILVTSNIREYLRGLYVDDGRSITDILPLGTKFDPVDKKFVRDEAYLIADFDEDRDAKELTETELK